MQCPVTTHKTLTQLLQRYTTDGLRLSATIACNGTFVIGGDVELELNGAPIGMRGQNKIEIKCENQKWIHNHIELKNVGCFYRSM
ncbi:hypothetical protein CAEBREN_18089 [Caenorhabditis brenneri]|uniref:Uncharacterized protein n=1 Tax=Caenorhabditis brenneri TaxID=135651 RepID=G0MB37_CAEBE|nr:hypothetical protein CAEBREN_18089 [Caenorhabditis brenneri]